MAQLWQFLLSLVAIAALVLLVHRLRLGDGAALNDEEDARRAAMMAIDDFAATHVSVGADGGAAILCDADGRVLLLRRHGSHIAGRLLDARAAASIIDTTLAITTSDPRFGWVNLAIADAPTWKARIDRLKQPGNA
ncbi:hypothetical protein [Porphyrobacter sp. GA68]|uniref:hypothetical protein n=1 Tax=Porphyrobacter sp. GA68 TaxID=2883480 RepID=UPI001D188F6E|nr:hypothetical protein [Porphyrobacter sp. GA68]